MKKLMLMTLLSATFIGCSEDSPIKEDPNLVDVPLSLQLNGEALTADQQTLVNSIAAKGKADYDALSRAFVAKHAEDYAVEESKNAEVARDELETYLDNLASVVEDNVELASIKTSYEQQMKSLASPNQFIYSANKYAMNYIDKENRLQCYSGTSLHQSILRKHYNRDQFEEKKIVFISEPRHVLSGYIENTDKGPVLYGIENTTFGESIIEYGYIDKYSDCVQITDANVYMTNVIFRDHLKNPDAVAKEGIKFTANKYSFDADRLAGICDAQAQQRLAAQANQIRIVGATQTGQSTTKTKRSWATGLSLPGPDIDAVEAPVQEFTRKVKPGATIPMRGHGNGNGIVHEEMIVNHRNAKIYISSPDYQMYSDDPLMVQVRVDKDKIHYDRILENERCVVDSQEFAIAYETQEGEARIFETTYLPNALKERMKDEEARERKFRGNMQIIKGNRNIEVVINDSPFINGFYFEAMISESAITKKCDKNLEFWY